MQRVIFGWLLLLLGSQACQNDSSTTENLASKSDQTSSAVEEPAKPVDRRQMVYLEGAYATSAESGFPLENMLDQDPTTAWRASRGAGPDEGFMLYFLGKTGPYLRSISLEQADTTTSGAVLEWEVYLNGQPVGRTGSAPLPLESYAKSLFFRIVKVANSQEVELERDGVAYKMRPYPANGITETHTLKVIGDKGQELRLVPPQALEASVTVSSTLDPLDAYHSSNLFDAKKEFAWVEGAPNAGEGETIAFNFSTPAPLSHLVVWNGYQRSRIHFLANARVQSLDIQVNEQKPADYSIADDTQPQVIRLPEADSLDQLTLTFTKVYPGGSYQDLAISELLFMDGDVPYKIANDWANSRADSRKKELAGSPLSPLLGKRVFNQRILDEEIGLYIDRSLILRTDGTFVYYNTEEDFDDRLEQVADGNWEILSANADRTQVKLFGRFVDFSQLELLYSGKSSEEFSRIFKEEIQITRTEINGKRFIGELYLSE